MFVNVNDINLPVTASSTPTVYAIPNPTCNKLRVHNAAGGVIVIKLETANSATLVAPVAGTKFNGSSMADGTVEMFDTNEETQYISVYSASGTGLVYIQSTNNDR